MSGDGWSVVRIASALTDGPLGIPKDAPHMKAAKVYAPGRFVDHAAIKSDGKDERQIPLISDGFISMGSLVEIRSVSEITRCGKHDVTYQRRAGEPIKRTEFKVGNIEVRQWFDALRSPDVIALLDLSKSPRSKELTADGHVFARGESFASARGMGAGEVEAILAAAREGKMRLAARKYREAQSRPAMFEDPLDAAMRNDAPVPPSLADHRRHLWEMRRRASLQSATSCGSSWQPIALESESPEHENSSIFLARKNGGFHAENADCGPFVYSRAG